jgi:hypothetical protein
VGNLDVRELSLFDEANYSELCEHFFNCTAEWWDETERRCKLSLSDFVIFL